MQISWLIRYNYLTLQKYAIEWSEPDSLSWCIDSLNVELLKVLNLFGFWNRDIYISQVFETGVHV
jgi:hypothetical protein